ncbi:uncharacterized protein Z518_06152 [Rhinocladiella mackenziei CBS 650.93]|uniref:F-box domain-containing protein n=1 Tax=Rhinocladiella mackenziei CBS 650.93 TaxID=1442369 RepID=A0A0D2J877_9EURO|nr:uncharacterized protein Z518_06152 [Rhinocladiella mackenziei CBS 650.93]KIX05280.1 hypothetical protein Z518_06152 [Rhinocladiella mackenziei CBS 650.93]
MANLPPRPAEIAQAENVLERYNRALEKAISTVMKNNKIASRMKKATPVNRLVQFDDVILKNEIIQPRDPLSKMPAEVQGKIQQALPLDDRFVLALTCKTHAKTYKKLRDKKLKNGKYLFPKPKRSTEIHRLQLLVRTPNWMPAN